MLRESVIRFRCQYPMNLHSFGHCICDLNHGKILAAAGLEPGTAGLWTNHATNELSWRHDISRYCIHKLMLSRTWGNKITIPITLKPPSNWGSYFAQLTLVLHDRRKCNSLYTISSACHHLVSSTRSLFHQIGTISDTMMVKFQTCNYHKRIIPRTDKKQ